MMEDFIEMKHGCSTLSCVLQYHLVAFVVNGFFLEFDQYFDLRREDQL